MDTKHTVLLVEDEAPAALALSQVLKDEGFEVMTAGDGEEGLNIALEKHPDVILADLKMPKMGGLAMIHKLREDAWGKSAKVVILTNASDVESIEQAMTEGAFQYLTKGDSSMDAIVEKVRWMLNSSM